MLAPPRSRSRWRVTTAIGICLALFATASAGLAATPDEPGSIVVTTVDPAGRPISNACLEVWTDGGGGIRGSRVGKGSCDADRVTDPQGRDPAPFDGLADGLLSFTGLARGRYVLVAVRPPSDASGTYERLADRAVDVRAGAITPITLVHRLPDAVLIHKVDPAGAPLPGACFEIDGGRLATVSGCDGPGSPALAPGDGLADGILVLSGLAKGTFTLHELHPPAGYTPAPDQAVNLPGGQPVEITVTNTLGPAAGAGGGLGVTIRDPLGTPVPNACFQLWTNAGGGVRGVVVPGKRACDAATDGGRIPAPADGLADGSVGFAGLAVGSYVLGQTQVASDATGAYLPVPDRVVGVRDGRLTGVEITNGQPGMVIIRTEADSGALLPGSCFVVDGGRIGGAAGCDGVGGAGPDFPIAGDGAPDGVVLLRRVEKGNHVLRQTRAPVGYRPAADGTVTVSATAETLVVVTNTLGGNTGSIVVTTVDPAGRPISNACLEVWTDGGGGIRGSRVGKGSCDADRVTDPQGRDPAPFDGLADGLLSFTGLARGRYVLVAVRPPSDASGTYERLADRAVDVRAGAITPITLVHRLPDAVLIHKVDPAGAPLPGACFEIDGGRLATVSGCDGPGSPALAPGDGLADGILVLAGLPKGRVTLHELHAPAGYTVAPDQELNLPGGQPVEITVTDTLGPATGGGGGKLGEVVSLELEIESQITIRALNGMVVTNGATRATGRIPLQQGNGSTWQGNGNLDSVTGSDQAACPSILVTGRGVYDWIVREVHAGPELAADAIDVSMDSGPINETPDRFRFDACSDPFEGELNTWENLFFDVYRSRYQAAGFHVTGWTLVGGADAWATGGVVAEASWTGNCATAFVLDCTDHTTFRLYGRAAVVATSPSPSATPGGGGGQIASASPGTVGSPAPSSLPGVEVPIAAVAGIPMEIVLVGGIAAVIAIVAFLWLRTMGSRVIVPLPAPTDPELPGVDYEKPPPIVDYEKPPPIVDYEKPPPIVDYEKPPPIVDYEKPPPIVDYEKPPPIVDDGKPPVP